MSTEKQVDNSGLYVNLTRKPPTSEIRSKKPSRRESRRLGEAQIRLQGDVSSNFGGALRNSEGGAGAIQITQSELGALLETVALGDVGKFRLEIARKRVIFIACHYSRTSFFRTSPVQEPVRGGF
jgi:hypothetical protein